MSPPAARAPTFIWVPRPRADNSTCRPSQCTTSVRQTPDLNNRVRLEPLITNHGWLDHLLPYELGSNIYSGFEPQ